MSDCGDDDVHICDTCMDIFLTSEELKQHEEEKHSDKEKQEEPSKAKRSRSNSPSSEAPKKKVKMGPASRVKRDRSSSSERSSSKKKEARSLSGSPTNGVAVAKIIDRLASTESDAGSHKSERSDRERGDHKKHKHKDREREKDRHEDRHKKKHKERDRSRDRKNGDRDKDRDRSRDRKNGDRDKDRDREKSKKLEKNGIPVKIKHVDMFGKKSSDDEEEAYRRAKERARADWEIKTDLSKSVKPFKKSDLDDFIDDGDLPKKKYRDEPRIDDEFKKKIREEARSVEKKSSNISGGFASQGTVKAHENDGGPECFKCGQVCKDNSNLKNHILSHYYQVFYEVLPDSKPYPCPICDSHSRDRITLVRHYAFTHKKFFEMTDVTPEHLGGARIGSKGVAAPRAKPQKKEEKPITRYDSDSDDDSSKKKLTLSNMSVEDKIKNMNSKFFRINDGSSNNQSEDDRNKDHKKHKKHKHKHKDHKEHKHHKEKKHKKEKHRDRDKEREETSSVNPLSSLIKDMSPVSDSSEPPASKDHGNDGSPRYKSPARDVHEDHVAADAGGDDNAEESDEDLLGDLDIAPVFA